MAINHVVALAGGVGGAKLALGLSRILEPNALSIVVNTGDDFLHYGLAIAPDLDTVMYTLAGVVNPETGWGVADDDNRMLRMLNRYGEEPWFGLGDADVATHLLRTKWLSEGNSLTEVTRRLSAALGVQHHILPMTDASVRTVLDTVEHGRLEFQEYFVKYRWQPTVTKITYQGVNAATPSQEVCDALTKADLIVFCPSNPVLSIAPILAVPGMRDFVANKPCVAVSPIIAGKAVKGPAAKLMDELGWSVTALAVAQYYGDLLTGFVLDERDQLLYKESDFLCGLLVTDTLMKTERDKIRLARAVLDWAEGIAS